MNKLKEIDCIKARYFPDMERGFNIETNYGSFSLEPESAPKEHQIMIDAIKAFVEKAKGDFS